MNSECRIQNFSYVRFFPLLYKEREGGGISAFINFINLAVVGVFHQQPHALSSLRRQG